MHELIERILVVDDDVVLHRLLVGYLSKFGYVVDAVCNGREMDAWLAANEIPDLLVLDVMMPGEDGLSIARRLRGVTNVPIIFHSASGEEIDRIVGLEIGADDYLAKPANPRELLARIRSILRRKSGQDVQTSGAPGIKPMVGPIFGDYLLDESRRQLRSPTRESIALSMRDVSLLKVFAERANADVSRDELMQLLRGFDRDPLDRSIDVCINRLRKKIEPDPSNPVYIRTIWGTGYRLTPDGDGIVL